MDVSDRKPIDVMIVAVPETSGSALYGMVDVLSATGTLWRQLVGAPRGTPAFRPRIVSPGGEPFRCVNGTPVAPDFGVEDNPEADIVVVPELWLDVDDNIDRRYPSLFEWLRGRYDAGSAIYSACSGAVLLAASGLLGGRDATSHWGHEDLFRTRFDDVTFRSGPNLVVADPEGRIVTAGGTTSWHDLVVTIIARYVSADEAVRVARAFLLKWHGEGQLPYAGLVRRRPHGDALVSSVEDWLAEHFCDAHVVAGAVSRAAIPERTLKRRFKKATGTTLISYVQNLRIEEAKRLLATESLAVDEISVAVGYENTSFFGRLFKRLTGLTPGAYRRMFRPIAKAGEIGTGPADTVRG
jgi:transcriptional regulator GlxA family with amidase domain